jgi:hypothetical protein
MSYIWPNNSNIDEKHDFQIEYDTYIALIDFHNEYEAYLWKIYEKWKAPYQWYYLDYYNTIIPILIDEKYYSNELVQVMNEDFSKWILTGIHEPEGPDYYDEYYVQFMKKIKDNYTFQLLNKKWELQGIVTDYHGKTKYRK